MKSLLKHILILLIFASLLYFCVACKLKANNVTIENKKVYTSERETTIISSFSNNESSIYDNLLDAAEDGMKCEEITMFYQKDIQEVKELCTNTNIIIRYNKMDVNDDGLLDYFVVIKSMLHSGSHGEYISVLLRQTDNNFKEISIPTLYVLGDNNQPVTIFKLLEQKTNGMHDIWYDSCTDADSIHWLKNTKFTLKYDGKKYTFDLNNIN